jgi:hypothetical protein
MGFVSMKRPFQLPALFSRRVIAGVGLLVVSSFCGGIGCGAMGLTYSLTGIYVQPEANLTCVAPGMLAQFTAYGSYTEGGHHTEIKDISDQVSWSASLPQLATISSSGLATAAVNYVGLTPIVATIQGEFGNLTADSSLQVSTTCGSTGSAVVTAPSGLHIVPVNQELSVGDTLQPLAVSTASGAPRTLLSRNVTWTSSNPGVAAVDGNGMIQALGPGDATISATTLLAEKETVSATEAVHVATDARDQ